MSLSSQIAVTELFATSKMVMVFSTGDIVYDLPQQFPSDTLALLTKKYTKMFLRPIFASFLDIAS